MIRVLDKAIADAGRTAKDAARKVADLAAAGKPPSAAAKATRAEAERARKTVEAAAVVAAGIGARAGAAAVPGMEPANDAYDRRRSGKTYSDGVPLRRRAAGVLGGAAAAGLMVGGSIARATTAAASVPRSGEVGQYAERVRRALGGPGSGPLRKAADKHVEKLRGMEPGSRDYQREIDSFRREIRQLGKDLARISAAEATASRWQARAKALAMGEVAGAFADGFMATLGRSRRVIGYRWNLSSAHSFYDVCDVHAEGGTLGRGGYPKGEVPDMPPHPGCLCYLTPIEEGE